MAPPGVYVETSALAKWYLNEARSEAVEQYLQEVCPAYISLLTKVEMVSLVGRRRREGQITPGRAGRILATLDGDVALGHLVLLPHTVETFLVAESTLGAFPDLPLRTLDALHLGVMRAAGITVLATADRLLARAAQHLGIECQTFFGEEPV